MTLNKYNQQRISHKSHTKHLPCDDSVSDGDSGGVDMVDRDESVDREDEEQDEEEEEGIMLLCMFLRLGYGLISRWIKLSLAPSRT